MVYRVGKIVMVIGVLAGWSGVWQRGDEERGVVESAWRMAG